MSHSPFPWSLHPQVPSAVFDAGGMKVANAVSPNAEDNAALIAAIPAIIEGLRAAIRAAELALFVINKQGVMPNSSWEGGFEKDLKKATDVLASIGKKQ